MSRVEAFNNIPPFPQDVPSIPLATLSLVKLITGDASESTQLFEACRETGFFLLDLRRCEQGEDLLCHAQEMFEMNKEIHELDSEELAKHAFNPPSDLFGYKRIGEMKLEDGSPDRIEFYSLSQDDILGNSSPRKHPDLIQRNRHRFVNFMQHANGVCCQVLAHLDRHLGLKPGTLASFSLQDQPSGTSLRMLKCLPKTVGSSERNLAGHTDMGSITMLFNVIGGLQILSSGNDNTEGTWRYVRPQPGCALINLGDAMVQWSGGTLRSNMHRVVTSPGDQARCTRFSVAYLVRPASMVSMRRVKQENGESIVSKAHDGEPEEEDICAKYWERMRAIQIMKGENRPESTGDQRNVIQ
ncbi:hypothetical protein ACLMJK_008689 [Lecanora helva]